MNALTIFMAAATLGVDYGWQTRDDGGLEYIIQIEPALLQSLKQGDRVISEVHPQVRGVRQFRIQVGDSRLPRETGVAVPETQPAGAVVPLPGTSARRSAPAGLPNAAKDLPTLAPSFKAADNQVDSGATPLQAPSALMPPATTDKAVAEPSRFSQFADPVGLERQPPAAADSSRRQAGATENPNRTDLAPPARQLPNDERGSRFSDKPDSAESVGSLQLPTESTPPTGLPLPTAVPDLSATRETDQQAITAQQPKQQPANLSENRPLPHAEIIQTPLPNESPPSELTASNKNEPVHQSIGKNDKPRNPDVSVDQQNESPRTETVYPLQIPVVPRRTDIEVAQPPKAVQGQHLAVPESSSKSIPDAIAAEDTSRFTNPAQVREGASVPRDTVTKFNSQADLGSERIARSERNRRPTTSGAPSKPLPAPASRPWLPLGLAVMALFASVSGNAYLGWIAWGAHHRYRELVTDIHTAPTV